MYLMAALLLPLRKLTCPAGKKQQPLSGHIIREGIKWRNKDVETTAVLHEAAPELLQLYRQLRDAGAGVRCAVLA
jgi:hypothetical protein